MIAAAVVEVGKLGEVVFYSLLATIGVATLFSLAVYGASRFSERRREASAEVLAYAALTLLCLAACLAASIYGVVLLASK